MAPPSAPNRAVPTHLPPIPRFASVWMSCYRVQRTACVRDARLSNSVLYAGSQAQPEGDPSPRFSRLVSVLSAFYRHGDARGLLCCTNARMELSICASARLAWPQLDDLAARVRWTPTLISKQYEHCTYTYSYRAQRSGTRRNGRSMWIDR